MRANGSRLAPRSHWLARAVLNSRKIAGPRGSPLDRKKKEPPVPCSQLLRSLAGRHFQNAETLSTAKIMRSAMHALEASLSASPSTGIPETGDVVADPKIAMTVDT